MLVFGSRRQIGRHGQFISYLDRRPNALAIMIEIKRQNYLMERKDTFMLSFENLL